MIQYLEMSPEEILLTRTSVLSEKQYELAFSGFRGKAQGLIAQGKTWIDKKSRLYLAVPWHPNNKLQQCNAAGLSEKGGWGGHSPPDFGISVNPTLTRVLQGGGGITPIILLLATPLDFQTFL